MMAEVNLSLHRLFTNEAFVVTRDMGKSLFWIQIKLASKEDQKDKHKIFSDSLSSSHDDIYD